MICLSVIITFSFCMAASAGEIHQAVESNNLPKVKAIIAADPSAINEKDSDGWTPLAYAARFGRKEIAQFLIQKKAAVNIADNNGYTPLHQAAAYDQRQLIELLLNNGADVNARTSGGVTPRRLAVSNGHKRAVDLLGSRGGK